MSSKKNQNEEDTSELVMDDELARETQPHLSRSDNGHAGHENSVSLDYINPALVDDADVNQTTNNNNTKSVTTDATTGTGSYTVASPPVHYSNRTGQSTIVEEPVIIRQANGVHVIRTQQCCHLAPHRHIERPLRIRNIKILQAFSILALVLFFPLGIPAVYFAFLCEKEFHAGILRGDIDLARKLATRTERLIVFSVLGALMVAVVVFAVVERNLMKDDEEYWRNRANGAVYPAG